jgi:hypothetical protein
VKTYANQFQSLHKVEPSKKWSSSRKIYSPTSLL